MLRDPGLFVQDILEAGRKVQPLVLDMDLEAFTGDWRTRDAVLHNLEVIGEAVKRLPEGLKDAFPGIPWKRIAGFRDVLAHAYFSLNDSIVWDVSTKQIGPLLEAASEMIGMLDVPEN